MAAVVVEREGHDDTLVEVPPESTIAAVVDVALCDAPAAERADITVVADGVPVELTDVVVDGARLELRLHPRHVALRTLRATFGADVHDTPLFEAAVWWARWAVVDLFITARVVAPASQRQSLTAALLAHAAGELAPDAPAAAPAGDAPATDGAEDHWTRWRLAADYSLNDAIARLLALGADVDARGAGGMTALMHLCRRGCAVAACEALLSAGAPVDVVCSTGMSALAYAARAGHGDACGVLLQHASAAAGLLDANGRTALIHAATSGNEKACVALLGDAHGGGLDILTHEDSYGYDAMHYAMDGGCQDVAVALMRAHARAVGGATGPTPATATGAQRVQDTGPGAGGSVGAATAEVEKQQPKPQPSACVKRAMDAYLLRAARCGLLRVCTEAVALGANPHARDRTRRTTVMVAAGAGHAAVCGWLVAAHACELDATDVEGRTALLTAALGKHSETCSALINAGARVDIEEPLWGQSAMVIAAKHGLEAVVVQLLTAGVPADTSDKDGRTALIYAAEAGWAGVCTLLASHGADVNRREMFERAAVHYAARRGHADVVAVLASRGAEVNAVDKHGKTPLMHAAEQEHPATCRRLVAVGAVVGERDMWYRKRIRIPACCLELRASAASDGGGGNALHVHARERSPASSAA